MRLITVQKFPNREIRVTLCQQPPAKPFSFETQDETETIDDAPRPRFLSFAQNSKLPTESKQSGILESQPKTGYGGLPRSKRFSSYGRRTILRAGGALESTHPHSECLFMTLTLPGSTREAFEALARYSAFAVQRFKAWLGKRIKNNLSIYTWEWQKRGALHLHYVVHCPSREDGEYILRNLRSEWIRILDAIAEQSGVDVYARHRGFSWKTNKEVVRTDGQWCRKSVAAYLSKYVSKEIGKQDSRHRNAFCPSRWYGVSRPLLQLLREMSYAVRLDYLRSHQALSLYEDCLSLLKSFSIKCYEYKHKVGTGKTLVSYSTSEDTNALWEEIVNTLVPEHNSCSNTEQNMRRIIRNGCILIRKHRIWLDTFMQFNGQFYGAKLLNAHYFKDISRLDLIYLADALAYAFRHVQRTRCSLPGECKLWYSQLRTCVDEASQEDKEWMGYLKL